MNSREHIRKIIDRETVDKCGFWLGKPQEETIEKLNQELGTTSLEDIQLKIGDDLRWINPLYYATGYQHPKGLPVRPWKNKNPHGLTGQGLLGYDSDMDELLKIDFPETKYLDFTDVLKDLDEPHEHYRLSGFWSPFFHDLTYLFGTEELLVFLLTEPELVEVATEKICSFYLEANELFLSLAADKIDSVFIGNDFGIQNSLMFSPDLFRHYFLPWVARFGEQARRYGLHLILHSCGSITEIIDDLIEAGVNCLHPLQTTAKGMNPNSLADKYGDRVTFMGGVDTQDLLLNGTPEDVEVEIQKLFSAFGNNFILGPSHEAILPNVKIENVVRLATYPRDNILT